MDICNPPLVWIGGSCYRKNPYMESCSDVDKVYSDTQDQYADDKYPPDDTKEFEDENSNLEIEVLANGRFRSSIHIANAYFAPIIGKKGTTKSRIERETKTRILIPKIGSDESEDIVITGETRNGVASACNRINLIAQSARNRQGFTHFISVPLNSKPLQDAFMEFKSDVLRECDGTRGLDSTIFQDSSLLHLTVCTLTLMDGSERRQAIEILQDCKEQVILPHLGEDGLEVEVAGLEIMNDDQAEVDVLYAIVKPTGKEETDKLQLICDQIVDKFVESGITSRQYDRVKLHLTLINSLFRKDENGISENESGSRSGTPKPDQRETFDARPIFKKFGNRNFGKFRISEIHLSQRRSSKRGPENYYLPSAVISLTSCD